MAFYDAIPASDGTTLTAPMNAEFKVFEVADTARANPLPLRSAAGLDAAPLVTTAQGVVPPVEVVSPNFEHIFQSGEWEWRRESSEGMRKATEEARAAAVLVQQRVESGDLKGGEGPQGKQGLPGVNAVPTQEAVATYMATPGSPVNDILAATYATQFKVTAYGPNVGKGNVAVDTAALKAATDSAAPLGAAVVVPAGITCNITQVAANAGANIIIEAGAEIVVQGNNAGIVSSGAAEAQSRPISAGATEGSYTLTIPESVGLAVGDWLFVTSNDTNGATAEYRGMLRRIVTISGSTITVDAPLYVTLPTSPVAVKVALAPPLKISGAGRIRSSNPSVQKSALIHVALGLGPVVEGVTIGPSGGPGTQVENCVGGYSTANYVDLMDDSATGHYGYAVNWTGATRGHVIAGGSAKRVRHGVTTNAQLMTIAGLTGYRGEPEGNVATAAYSVSDTRNAGLDTHRAGQGNTLIASVTGCAIGVQDRATNTVISGTVQGATKFGFHVTDQAENTLLLSPTIIGMGQGGDGAAAFRIAAPCTLDSPYHPAATPGVPSVNATADYTVRGGGHLAGATAGTGRRSVGLWGGASRRVTAGEEILAALASFGFLSAADASITTGLVNLTGSGTVQGRALRAAATAAADIPLRVDAPTASTGDLAQFRTNGSNRVRFGSNGEIEVVSAAAGIILRSPNGTRYRLTVNDAGAVGVAPA